MSFIPRFSACVRAVHLLLDFRRGARPSRCWPRHHVVDSVPRRTHGDLRRFAGTGPRFLTGRPVTDTVVQRPVAGS